MSKNVKKCQSLSNFYNQKYHVIDIPGLHPSFPLFHEAISTGVVPHPIALSSWSLKFHGPSRIMGNNMKQQGFSKKQLQVVNYPLPFWFVVQRSTFWIACGKTLSKLKTVGKSSMMRQVMEALLNRKASISSIVDLPEMSCWIHSEYPSPLNLYTSLTAAGTHALFCI